MGRQALTRRAEHAELLVGMPGPDTHPPSHHASHTGRRVRRWCEHVELPDAVQGKALRRNPAAAGVWQPKRLGTQAPLRSPALEAHAHVQVAIAPTLLVALVYRHRRGTELDQLNEFVNVLQSIQLPFALLPACLAFHAFLLCPCLHALMPNHLAKPSCPHERMQGVFGNGTCTVGEVVRCTRWGLQALAELLHAHPL